MGPTVLELLRVSLMGAALYVGAHHLFMNGRQRRRLQFGLVPWSFAVAIFLAGRALQHGDVSLDAALFGCRIQFVVGLMLTPLSILTLTKGATGRIGRFEGSVAALTLLPALVFAATDLFIGGITTVATPGEGSVPAYALSQWAWLFLPQAAALLCCTRLHLLPLIRDSRALRLGGPMAGFIGLGFLHDLLVLLAVLDGPLVADLGLAAGVLLPSMMLIAMPRRELEALEDALAQGSHQLADQLRAREALEVQLQRSERLATVGTLAAGVAHEINNPLSLVLLNLEELLGEPVRPWPNGS